MTDTTNSTPNPTTPPPGFDTDRFFLLLTDGIPDGVARYASESLDFFYYADSGWVLDNTLYEIIFDPSPGAYREVSPTEALTAIRDLFPRSS